MKIKITGSNGYLGKSLSKELKRKGHDVSGISRPLLYGSIKELKKEIQGSEIIINLAGAPILKRWSKKNKSLISNSRIQTTNNLVRAINELPIGEQPKKFISASAIGIYKPGFNHNENSTNFDYGFVGNIVKEWEEASINLPTTIQRTIFRIGIVLGKEAKTIQNLLLPFKLGLGATIGDGKQAFPFIHETDLFNAFIWAVEKKQKGIFNLVAPENINNKEFTKALAKQLKRPAFLFIPAFLIKTLLGEASGLLLKGAEVEPESLLEAAFDFRYPTIEMALKKIIQ